jgi:hypothetical protein
MSRKIVYALPPPAEKCLEPAFTIRFSPTIHLSCRKAIPLPRQGRFFAHPLAIRLRRNAEPALTPMNIYAEFNKCDNCVAHQPGYKAGAAVNKFFLIAPV